MTDYSEEQANELEALRSIFPDEFEELDPGPPAHFTIAVSPDPFAIESLADADGNLPEASLKLDITYTDTYPDSAPVISLEEIVGLDDDEAIFLRGSLNATVEESMGMAMVFSIASAAKENFERILLEREETRKREEAERAAAEEEAERQRLSGSRVTKESFEAWKAGFLAEISQILKSKGEDALTPAMKTAASIAGMLESSKKKAGKLTGREQFMKNRGLATSDVGMMDEGDVAVDVELFEGMEDLDIDDEDEDQVVRNFGEDD
ncbi:RWD domain-containing protein 1 [Gaertneriomyces sp. JEL0708]|nr:RWD domain-containing protein 1 [Gaertneriomyces sp. JEL0708]